MLEYPVSEYAYWISKTIQKNENHKPTQFDQKSTVDQKSTSLFNGSRINYSSYGPHPNTKNISKFISSILSSYSKTVTIRRSDYHGSNDPQLMVNWSSTNRLRFNDQTTQYNYHYKISHTIKFGDHPTARSSRIVSRTIRFSV